MEIDFVTMSSDYVLLHDQVHKEYLLVHLLHSFATKTLESTHLRLDSTDLENKVASNEGIFCHRSLNEYSDEIVNLSCLD